MTILTLRSLSRNMETLTALSPSYLTMETIDNVEITDPLKLSAMDFIRREAEEVF
jgi:hypothetical protein